MTATKRIGGGSGTGGATVTNESRSATAGSYIFRPWPAVRACCCIGIPPTPYDAIEVRLGSTVTGDTRLTTYGVIKGRFKVDPHLVGGWLVGMYVMDQAKLTPKAFGGVAP